MQTFKLKRHVSLVMVFVMMMIYAPLPSALAAMIATDAASGPDATADQRTKITVFLERADVVQLLSARGIDPAEAAERVASLTDSEVDRLARKIDQLPAGGGLLGTLAVIAVVFFLVLLLLELTGFTDVFSFINSPRR